MTLAEVCAFLRIPVGTARKQRAEGKFVPGYRVGKYLRFRRSAVLEWLEEHADEI
ncbi:helix-turn-helix domain-containing protein [Cryptosporangium japonicum]|uniref:Helix-turn-helix domain-containing protein n=1 Tax=Cryptosporangium japonicum TaxID=80872 RepID=A0ABN0UY97_9ACTN